MTTLLVATRSRHKLDEIRHILRSAGEWRLVDLAEAGIAPAPEEDSIEAYDTFRENALAKARYFFGLSGLLTLADDSGLCVDALGGAPGVRSRRFSGRADLSGDELDRANNELLLERLRGVPPAQRTGRYVCAAALVGQGREEVATGECAGVILEEPRGSGGFGYDPLVLAPSEGLTFGELPVERKNRISHRAHALREIAALLRGWRSPGEGPVGRGSSD